MPLFTFSLPPGHSVRRIAEKEWCCFSHQILLFHFRKLCCHSSYLNGFTSQEKKFANLCWWKYFQRQNRNCQVNPLDSKDELFPRVLLVFLLSWYACRGIWWENTFYYEISGNGACHGSRCPARQARPLAKHILVLRSYFLFHPSGTMELVVWPKPLGAHGGITC